MPLTRDHVTIASRVMLPCYPVFALGVGLSFLLTPHGRLLATPTLAYIDQTISLEFVGAGFLAVAAVLAAALVTHRRRTYQLALAVMCLWMLAYAGFTLASAITAEASWSAWTWPAMIAAACWASSLSLAAQET